MTALFGLAAAFTFGISDIAGAMAARRSSAVRVSLGLEIAGLPVLLVAVLFTSGVASSEALLLGALAGIVGDLGLILYLRAMATGPVGVISPLAALVGAGVPVAWGVAIVGDRLSALQVLGVLLGLAAVVLVAWKPGTPLRGQGLRGPLVAMGSGVLFGLFFVVIDATPADSGLWPLVSARVAGIVVLMAIARLRPGERSRHVLGLMVVAGIADVAASVLFLLATRSGLLSLASLLTSLYPVVALVLARQLLKERLSRTQATGVTVALAATAALIV